MLLRSCRKLSNNVRSRTFRTSDFARVAGIVHFVASFGLTVGIVLALQAGSRSFTESTFSAFGILYVATAVLAFATMFLSLRGVPVGELRARSKIFWWILAAQASFTLQAGAIWLWMHMNGLPS